MSEIVVKKIEIHEWTEEDFKMLHTGLIPVRKMSLEEFKELYDGKPAIEGTSSIGAVIDKLRGEK